MSSPIMLGSKTGSRLSPILVFCLICFGFLFFVRPYLSDFLNEGRDRSPTFNKSKQSNIVNSSSTFDWASDISVVWTWVNGSVPEQARLRKQYGGPSISGRFRDNEDLRYSMRTWINHAPWHKGKIYIVSPTPPDWLDLTHTRYVFRGYVFITYKLTTPPSLSFLLDKESNGLTRISSSLMNYSQSLLQI